MSPTSEFAVYNRNVARYRGQKIKRIAALFVGLAAFLPVAEGSARARDLPRSDPDRLAILNAARGKDDAKFIVKDLFKSGDFAFLCALKQDPKYGIARTDEMLDVYLFVFIKHESAWIAVNAGLLGASVVFDSFPYGLLTMIVSLEAIFLATFVMRMSRGSWSPWLEIAFCKTSTSASLTTPTSPCFGCCYNDSWFRTSTSKRRRKSSIGCNWSSARTDVRHLPV